MRSILSFVFSLTILTTYALPTVRDTQGYLVLSYQKVRQASGGDSSSQLLEAQLTNELSNYVIDVTVGTPPQSFAVVLDTGSSDVWFYAPESVSSCSDCTTSYYDYSGSSTEEPLNDLGVFNISYGSTQGVTGFYASDILTVSGVSVRQTIGVATVAYAGTPPGGIMGIGLSAGESIVYEYGYAAEYPGYIDTLKNSGVINTRAYSIFLNDKEPADTTPGTIIFGGYDSSKWTGELVAFPMVEPDPYDGYSLDIAVPAIDFVIDGQKYNVGPSSAEYSVLLDTGTAISRIPADQFEAINSVLGLEAEDSSGQFYYVNCNAGSLAGGFDFTFYGPNGDVTISVPWAELILPNGGETCIFGLAPILNVRETEAILGDTVLRSAYLLYDFDSLTISLAQVNYDQSTDSVKSL